MARLTAIVPATDAPRTLERCVAAIREADDAPDELIVVTEPRRAGPAQARNLGAAKAVGDVLVFVDADVEVHADAFTRIRGHFAGDQELTAVFGSYDDDPAAPGLVSGFRNLLHHHVHSSSAGPSATFWAGLGAIRRSVFLELGGFDAKRYRRPSIEDIELGVRIASKGGKVFLDPRIRGRHLKSWGLYEMIATDFLRRGIPWVELLARHRLHSTALNLSWRQRLGALGSVVFVAGAAARRPLLAGGGLLVALAPNRSFYLLLRRRRGRAQALAAVPLHLIHHLVSAIAVPVGLARVALGLRGRRREP